MGFRVYSLGPVKMIIHIYMYTCIYIYITFIAGGVI